MRADSGGAAGTAGSGDPGSEASRGQSSPGTLVLRDQVFAPGSYAVMAIVNRTPDSFYDRGANFALASALARLDQVVADGADIVDIGGVRAGHGADVDEAEELARTLDFVAQARERYPRLVLSVDTWRATVADRLCAAGADLVNDTWSGHDPEVASAAAQHGAGLVCSHTGGLPPRTDPHRVAYTDVMADVIRTTTSLAARAVTAGVRRDGILVDPTHDFGKNTRHSLEVTRRLGELVATGWPVLVAVSNKDFIGETLGLPPAQRLSGTLATTAVCALLGARVFRAHDVAESRQTLEMVAAINGDRQPAVNLRGLV
jgi:dihydropteroate synthase